MNVSTSLLPLLLLGAVLAGCSRSEAATKRDEAPPMVRFEALAAGKPAVDKAEYKVSIRPSGPCVAGTECRAEIQVEAQGEFHVNKEYPHKWKADDVAGVEFLGKPDSKDCPGGPTLFRACAGDFKAVTAAKGVLAIRFKPSKAGTVTLNGPYKFSVCTDQNCLIDMQVLSVDVPVTSARPSP